MATYLPAPTLALAVTLSLGALVACEPAAAGFRPNEPGIPARSAAERACIAQAERQLLEVHATTDPAPIMGRRARVVAETVIMQVSRHGQRYTVRCLYDWRNMETTISRT